MQIVSCCTKKTNVLIRWNSDHLHRIRSSNVLVCVCVWVSGLLSNCELAAHQNGFLRISSDEMLGFLMHVLPEYEQEQGVSINYGMLCLIHL